MNQTKIENDYFEWMFDLVCKGRYDGPISYRRLLSYLHDIEFTYSIPKDSNRAEDGVELRYRFSYETGCACADRYLDGPCSVLEMMIALSFRCEEIMDDAMKGDRTAQWFWKMIVNLGLGSMTDSRFDLRYVENAIDVFLNREYEADGRGGLFTVRDCRFDMRDLEIWIQMCYFLDNVA